MDHQHFREDDDDSDFLAPPQHLPPPVPPPTVPSETQPEDPPKSQKKAPPIPKPKSEKLRGIVIKQKSPRPADISTIEAPQVPQEHIQTKLNGVIAESSPVKQEVSSHLQSEEFKLQESETKPVQQIGQTEPNLLIEQTKPETKIENHNNTKENNPQVTPETSEAQTEESGETESTTNTGKSNDSGNGTLTGRRSRTPTLVNETRSDLFQTQNPKSNIKVSSKSVVFSPELIQSGKSKKENAIKDGFLEKKGHVILNWKRRWFVLTPAGMEYYEKPSSQKPKVSSHFQKERSQFVSFCF